jgi:hypothetical protein
MQDDESFRAKQNKNTFILFLRTHHPSANLVWLDQHHRVFFQHLLFSQNTTIYIKTTTNNIMKTSLICASLIGSAAAFAPSPSHSKVSIALNAEKDDKMSKALPFAPRPKMLDGSMAGDVGFE